jgi:hypothetical protein
MEVPAMSRLMTLSEMYALLLHDDLFKSPGLPPKNIGGHPVFLNRHSPVAWINPTTIKPTPLPHLPKREQTQLSEPVNVSPSIHEAMEQVARSCGISINEAWSDAAQAWMIQRQRDMDELATPDGQELAGNVRRVWSLIDKQLQELRSMDTGTTYSNIKSECPDLPELHRETA